MERIKFDTNEYELVANGVQLTDQGGRVILKPGVYGFDAVDGDLKTAKSIVVLDELGAPFITRTDLVYAGRLSKDDNYVIGITQTEGGTEDVIGTVMIAEFRVPDMREKVTELEAKLAYVTMMTGIDMEV